MDDPFSIEPGDLTWPAALADLQPDQIPHELRVVGTWPPGPGKLAVAVVGTRYPSAEGEAFARRLTADLVAEGAVIWSGGAVGIDAAAHEAALDAGGSTVAVLGSGIIEGFPRENAALFRRIATSPGSALVSCEQDDTAASSARFKFRNRVVAACSQALIVVECDDRSGARNAAWAARLLQRPVGVVPFGPGVAREGNVIELTQLGANPIYCARNVLEIIARRGRPISIQVVRPARRRAKVDRSRDLRLPEPPPNPPSNADELRVLDLIRATPLHVDALCERTGLSAAAMGRILFALDVEGHVTQRGPGNWLALARSALDDPSPSPDASPSSNDVSLPLANATSAANHNSCERGSHEP
jgi:DNA processing protein